MSCPIRSSGPKAASSTRSMAAVDYFIKFDGIKGESADVKHKDEIDVESWSFGETNVGGTGPGGGGGAGKVAMQDFHFVMRLNRASPSLMKACATGQHIKTATLSARKAGKGQQEYLVVKLNDVLITGVVHGGTSGAAASETVSLVFGKVDFEYKPQKADGSLGAGIHFKFDIKSSKVG